MTKQKSFSNNITTLYIVSTPIGNLKDITYRAVEILEKVSLILVEDTRKSGVLLKHYNIKTKMVSYHEFNKDIKKDEIISLLKNGQDIALISDAGTPGISDPGYEIIKEAIKEKFNVVAIPGASALLASLVVSGLVIQPFIFIGFLPRKKNALEEFLLDYKSRMETLVIYESPLRIKETLNHIYDIFGNREITLSRELTKVYETVTRGSLADIRNASLSLKGEYVIIIEGINKKTFFDTYSTLELYNIYISDGLSEKEAMKKVAKNKKIAKSDIYRKVKVK